MGPLLAPAKLPLTTLGLFSASTFDVAIGALNLAVSSALLHHVSTLNVPTGAVQTYFKGNVLILRAVSPQARRCQ